jgi:hypothetical protein
MGGLLGGMHALRNQASRNNELLSNHSLSIDDDHYLIIMHNSMLILFLWEGIVAIYYIVA